MAKDKDRMKKFMVFFIAFIMIMSVFGVIFYGMSDPSAKKKYGKLTFTRMNNGYRTFIEKNSYDFVNFPGDISEIEIDDEVKGILDEKSQIILTSEPDDPLNRSIAYLKFNYQNTANVLTDTYVTSGFTKKNVYNQPIVNCTIANENIPVIYMKRGNETGITSEKNCVIISAESDFEMIMLGERILFMLLDIIK
ncbi:MAG: hypothetical protein ABII01_01475 [Candidatus Woesearchaeota archaeon]